MAERHRSKDGTRETDQFIEGMPETPDQQGRSGGEIAREVGTAAALEKATTQGTHGVKRVTKSHQDVDVEEE